MNHFEIQTLKQISINREKRKRFPYQDFADLREISRNNLKNGRRVGKATSIVVAVAVAACHRVASQIVVTVRVNTALLSIQIPSHRPPPLALKSCELFDPNERPPMRAAAANWDDEQRPLFGHGGWQNDVILSLEEIKRCRFIFIFFKIHNKTTSFWTKLVQNGVILKQLSLTQMTLFWVCERFFKTMPFWTIFVQNDTVLV